MNSRYYTTCSPPSTHSFSLRGNDTTRFTLYVSTLTDARYHVFNLCGFIHSLSFCPIATATKKPITRARMSMNARSRILASVTLSALTMMVAFCASVPGVISLIVMGKAAPTLMNAIRPAFVIRAAATISKAVSDASVIKVGQSDMF